MFKSHHNLIQMLKKENLKKKNLLLCIFGNHVNEKVMLKSFCETERVVSVKRLKMTGVVNYINKVN